MTPGSSKGLPAICIPTGSPAALTAIKRLVEDTRGITIDQAHPFTTRTIADLRASDEGREGLSAFLEKRKPLKK